MITSVLFDLDGTLTDSAPGITRCIGHALDVVGLPPVTPARLQACVGPPLRESFLALGAASDQVEALIAAYRERYVDVGLLENEIYPGVPELLGGLRSAGLDLHVATSKPHVYAERVLDHFGLRIHFDRVYGAELDGRRSKKTELIEAACGELVLSPARTAMVGDRGVDMSAARELGLTALGASWGYGSSRELEEAGAHALASAPGDLEGLIARVGD
jgi:phosphoglycolate phosphatase